jgi:hypothetical protein
MAIKVRDVDLARRQVLRLGLGAAALGTFGNAGAIADPIGTWGRPEPAIFPDNFFPQGKSFYKVIEIHLYGGLSPWETFYHRPVADGRGYRGFEAGAAEVVTALHWHQDSQSNANLCQLAPASAGETMMFSTTGGDTVHFGPATKPLWPDLLDRTCVVILQHNLLPHEAAIPYVATGSRLGQPRLAGLGAAIQRRAIAIEEATTGRAFRRTTPWSYVLEPSGVVFNDNLDAFKATGQHPGSSKPVTLGIRGGGLVGQLQNRRSIRNTHQDTLLKFYRDEYERMLRYPGHAAHARAVGFDNYLASLSNALNAEQLAAQLNGAIQPVGNDTACVSVGPSQIGIAPNQPAAGIRSAVRLLSNTEAPAHYVCVIDAGLVSAPGGGAYDTHSSVHSSVTATNLWNVLATLRQLIDSNALDLNTTLIVLTTEFGRTPYRSSGGVPDPASSGRDHWPQGFTNVLVGGPIRSRRILGRIKDGDISHGGAAAENGVADAANVFNATDVRAAVLLAAGIDPFADGLFGGADVSPSLVAIGDNVATSKNILDRFFR